MNLETREILAGAYVGRLAQGRSLLSHAIEVDPHGRPVRALCGRVRLDSLADAAAGDVHAIPSCGLCRQILRRTTDPTRSAATQPYRTTRQAQQIAKSIIEVDEAVEIVRQAWPQAYQRGRILHIHQNAVRLKDGSYAHVRLLVQQLTDADAAIHLRKDDDDASQE